MLARLPLIVLIAAPVFAQSPCEGTPAYSPCEMTFELSAADLAAHRNPYADIQLQVEFKSPRFHTYAMPAFWDGGRKMTIRFSPPKPANGVTTSRAASRRWTARKALSARPRLNRRDT
jgi:hypothetical protein